MYNSSAKPSPVCLLNIDVTIVDDQRVRLAGTGRYKDSVGEVVSENAAFSYALREGHGFIIENPGAHQACLNCDCKDKCTEHAEVCCPIHLDGKTIGVIGLIAFKDSQRKALLSNQQNLMAFLDRMADLIASKLAKEQESHDAVDMLAKELEVVIDNLDTDLIAVGTDGQLAGRIGGLERPSVRKLNMLKRYLVKKSTLDPFTDRE